MDQSFTIPNNSMINSPKLNTSIPNSTPHIKSSNTSSSLIPPNQLESDNFKSPQAQNLAQPPLPPPHRPTASFSSSNTARLNSTSSRPPPPLPQQQQQQQPPQIPPHPSSLVSSHSHTSEIQLPRIPHINPIQPPHQNHISPPPQPINNGRAHTLEKLKPGTILTVGKHQVTIMKYLSAGGFAHIYIVKTNPMEQGTDIACLKRVIVPNKEGLNQLRAEVEVMQRLSKAENIVRYYDSNASRLPNNPGSYEVLVLMELCPNKSLLDFMNSRLKTKLTLNEILKIMLDISKALYNMHKIKLIHRDIKIENVLLDENFNFKLADFGSTCPILRVPRNQQEFQILHNDILTQTTPQYRSPEMIDLYRGLPIDEKSDIWALGVFLYKLCYYTTPFEICGELGILHSAYTFPIHPNFPNSLKALINLMLQENPIFRPNIYQVLIEICRISGFNSELIQKITIDNGYTDFYGLGEYQYPSNDQIHPAIEPFTPSIVPMYSPFKTLPRDPLEVQMEIKMMQQKQQQQQQQQEQEQQQQQKLAMTQQKPAQQQAPPPPPIKSPSSSSSNLIEQSQSSSSTSNLIPNSTSDSNNISTIEEADPFSMHNLNKQKNESNTTEFGIINSYSKESSSSNIKLDNSINNNTTTRSIASMEDKDIFDEKDMETRFPAVSVSSVPSIHINPLIKASTKPMVSSPTLDSNTNGILNPNDSAQLNSLNRSRSKRYSSNNPFPKSNNLDAERTGDSIISFEDIKNDLINLDNEPSDNSLQKFENKSSASLNKNGSLYRRLSSEQLSQEVINFSDEDVDNDGK